MSKNINRLIQKKMDKEKEEAEKKAVLENSTSSVVRDPKMRLHIERAAEVLFKVAKIQRKKLGNPKQQAKLMKQEAEENKEKIGMIFDRNRREILKYIKKN